MLVEPVFCFIFWKDPAKPAPLPTMSGQLNLNHDGVVPFDVTDVTDILSVLLQH
jgi:hypothetical protein